jgi:hypothetical protein
VFINSVASAFGITLLVRDLSLFSWENSRVWQHYTRNALVVGAKDTALAVAVDDVIAANGPGVFGVDEEVGKSGALPGPCRAGFC